MIDLIEVIRSATALDATAEARAAGAQACRTILASLEPQPEPAPVVEQAPPVVGDPGIAQLAELAGALRGVPIDQLLDLAIAKLRNAVPKDMPLPSAEGVRFQLVPVVPYVKRSGS